MSALKEQCRAAALAYSLEWCISLAARAKQPSHFLACVLHDLARVQVSWPAYSYRRAATANVTGANPFNQDLWFHSAAVGHEFRFYNDNNAQWAHILDIASFTHEAGMSRCVVSLL